MGRELGIYDVDNTDLFFIDARALVKGLELFASVAGIQEQCGKISHRQYFRSLKYLARELAYHTSLAKDAQKQVDESYLDAARKYVFDLLGEQPPTKEINVGLGILDHASSDDSEIGADAIGMKFFESSHAPTPA